MTAPRSAPPGRSGADQPGDTTARQQEPGQPETAVPRQPGTAPAGQAGQAGQADASPARQPGTGHGSVEERFAAETLAPLGSQAWLAVFAASVGLMAVGIVLLVWPHATLTIVAILLGVSLIVSGLLRLFEGLTANDQSGAMRTAYVLVGLLAAVVGLYCLRHHDVTLFLLAFIVGAFWIIHGVADLAVAAASGPMPGRWLTVITGLFGIGAGAVVLFWPGISLLLLLTILGAWLIFYGIVLGALAFRLRREAPGA
jgi:uncharacterized membrane protein HdeD (DUF308 family)